MAKKEKTSSKKQATCLVCKKEFIYYSCMSKGLYCSVKCRYEDHSNIIKKSYTPQLKKLKSDLAKKQMQNKEQIAIRQEKCGYEYTPEQIEAIKERMTKNAFLIAKRIIIKERGRFCQRHGGPISGKGQLVVHHINGRKWDNNTENLLILCKSCHSKLHSELSKVAGRFAGLATVENYIAKILESLGIDLDDPNFNETPLRVARMYQELFEATKPEAQNELKAIFSSKFPSDNDNMVVCRQIKVYSLCPHHLLPVDYSIVVAYIPDKIVLGISKFTRIAELMARKPILQEQLTVDIAACIQKELSPIGTAVQVSGKHYCMVMRGVKQDDPVVITSHLLGAFKDEPETRAEFMSLARGL